MTLVTRIGVRELRQHASRYLDMVKAGETVEVTERGELVALLVSPGPALAAHDRLVAAGRLVPAKAPFRLPARRVPPADPARPLPPADPTPRVPPADPATASDVLAELREERLS